MKEYEKVAWLLALFSKYERGMLQPKSTHDCLNSERKHFDMIYFDEIKDYCIRVNKDIYGKPSTIRVIREDGVSWEFEYGKL
jgi:hypothetical protein